MTLVVAVVLVALTACSHHIGAGQPVDVPPSAAVTGVGCTVYEPGVGHAPVSGLVNVDPDPSSVVAIWSPGGNASPCQNLRTTGGRTGARALAHDVRTAPKFPSGTFNCPSDDGAGVRLYFAFDGNPDEYVIVSLGGCGGISAPQRGFRQATPSLSRDLAPIAPPQFMPRLT